jgi:hypothetical protein
MMGNAVPSFDSRLSVPWNSAFQEFLVELVEYFDVTLRFAPPRLFHYILFGSIFILFGIVDSDFGC